MEMTAPATATFAIRYIPSLTGKRGRPGAGRQAETFPAPIRFPLEPDSFLVLISDGVADPGDDEWLQNLLAGWQGEEPQRLVSLILSESRSHGGLRDDCSVLCLYLPPSGRQV